MKYPWSSLSGFPKALVICIAILLVSGGLCGLQLAISSAANSGPLTSFLMIPGIFELAAFWGAALGTVVCLIGWIGSAIYRSFSGARSETEQLSKNDSENQDKSN
jgi:hypothetical protein